MFPVDRKESGTNFGYLKFDRELLKPKSSLIETSWRKKQHFGNQVMVDFSTVEKENCKLKFRCATCWASVCLLITALHYLRTCATQRETLFDLPDESVESAIKRARGKKIKKWMCNGCRFQKMMMVGYRKIGFNNKNRKIHDEVMIYL